MQQLSLLPSSPTRAPLWGGGCCCQLVKDGGADVLNGAQHGQALTAFQGDRPFSAIAEHRAGCALQ